jgi:hypothetical protein
MPSWVENNPTSPTLLNLTNMVSRYFEWISHRVAAKRRQLLTFSAPEGRSISAPPGLTTAAPELHCLIENSDKP